MAGMRLSGRSRAGIASRVIAAVVGGYALATLATLALAYGLPGSRAGALMTGMMASFAVYAAAIVWAFAARSATFAWTGILAGCAACGAACLLLRAGGA